MAPPLVRWAAALFVFLSVPAWSTSFVDIPFPETVQDTPILVRGIVGNNYADWGTGADGNKRLYTFYDLRVSEVLKGQVDGSSLLMREMGGEKDGIGMQVPGASQFDRGEDVVVMLSARNPDGSYDIRGLMMGKMNIKRNESGKEILIGPAVQGMGELHEGGHSDTGNQQEWSLERLRSLIRAQGGAPSRGVSPQNTSPAASLRPADAPSPKPAPEAASPAPQLQISRSEEPKSPSGFAWVGLALGVGIFAVVMFLKRI